MVRIFVASINAWPWNSSTAIICSSEIGRFYLFSWMVINIWGCWHCLSRWNTYACSGRWSATHELLVGYFWRRLSSGFIDPRRPWLRFHARVIEASANYRATDCRSSRSPSAARWHFLALSKLDSSTYHFCCLEKRSRALGGGFAPSQEAQPFSAISAQICQIRSLACCNRFSSCFHRQNYYKFDHFQTCHETGSLACHQV